jgi:hypothetical protein
MNTDKDNKLVSKGTSKGKWFKLPQGGQCSFILQESIARFL